MRLDEIKRLDQKHWASEGREVAFGAASVMQYK